MLCSDRVVLRDVREDDVRALAAIHYEAVTVAYSGLFPPDVPALSVDDLEAEWAAVIGDTANTVVVADVTGRAVGMVLTRADLQSEGMGELRRLHVLPALWGRGLGSLLHDAALSRLRKTGFGRAALWVLADNARARAMYERRGWQLVPEAVFEYLGVTEVRYERVVCRDVPFSRAAVVSERQTAGSDGNGRAND